MRTTRRRLLQTAGAAGFYFASPMLRSIAASAQQADMKAIKIGFISDIHQDVMHDGVERLTAFIDAMKKEKVDFIVNLGDFCVPHPRNDAFIKVWESFDKPRYHVIGNHDTDRGFNREQFVKKMGMRGRYYSEDIGNLHLVVLDGNDPDGKTRGYQRYIAPEQLQWLEQDLAKTDKPTIVCVHQQLDAYDKGVKNAPAVRKILAEAKTDAGVCKVVAVFCGHAHLDYVKESDGIPHVQVNSASYVWTSIKHKNYPPEVTKKAPWTAYPCPYAEPLWVVATLDFQNAELRLDGRKTEWVGPDPWELGIKEDDYNYNKKLCRPEIKDVTIKL